MRAWQAIAYGAPGDALRLVSIARPQPSAGELSVRVFAASLNPIDYKLLRGDLRRIEQRAFPFTPGFDACGVVDATGEGVDDFQVGDRVFLRGSRDTMGAFAEVSLQPASFVARAPQSISAAAAASLPLVALTTVQALVDRAHAQPGQRVLIHAGSGGLGSFAIQYARHLGLVVDTTTSAANAAWVGALGAERVIAYDREDYRDAGPVYDIVFDTLGGAHTLDAFSVVKHGGCVVSVAGPPDHDMTASVAAGFLVRTVMKLSARKVYAAAHAVHARYYRFLTQSNGIQLAAVAALVDAGELRPVVDRVFPFEECIAAFEYLMAGRAKGKVLLDVDGESPDES